MNNKHKPGGYVNKTFRLPAEELRRLEMDAASANRSTNGLIVSILERYLEWGSYANAVRMVSLPPNMVDGILANVTEEQMSNAGTYIAHTSCFKGLSLHLFQAYNPTLFAKLMTFFDRYGNNYQVQADKSPSGGINVSLYHGFGKKWSLLVGNLLHHELLRLEVKDHTFEVSENAVVFNFPDNSIQLPPEYMMMETVPAMTVGKA